MCFYLNKNNLKIRWKELLGGLKLWSGCERTLEDECLFDCDVKCGRVFFLFLDVEMFRE